MFLYDHRMIEGSPLQYYYEPVAYECYPPYLQYEAYPVMSDEMMMVVPHSPSSIQSDSENSISSIEVSPKPHRRNAAIECIWPACGIVLDSLDKMTIHVDRVHRSEHSISKLDLEIGKEIQCLWQNCGHSFGSLDELATHVSKVHAASGPGGLFYCGWEGCTRNNRGFNARYKMLVHVRTHTNEKPHRCYQCNKSFSRAENLKIHTRSHSGEKPYVCPVPGCNKAYSNSSDRFKHTRTHQVDKPYQCKVPGCPKRYTDPSSLRKHVKTYKHFVNENAAKEIKEDVHIKRCDCQHNCCIASCFTQASDLLKLGALMNLKENEEQWNIFGETKLFTPYDLKSTMDIDSPLDLSISRK